MVKNGRRKRSDDALALSIACGSSLRVAAKENGFGERTAWRRMNDPEFRARVDTIRAAIVDQGIGKIIESIAAAADTLRDLLTAESESVRLGAAKGILDAYSKFDDRKTDSKSEASVNINVGVERNGYLTVDQPTMIDALTELRNAGVSLDELVDRERGVEPAPTIDAVSVSPPAKSEQTLSERIAAKMSPAPFVRKYDGPDVINP